MRYLLLSVLVVCVIGVMIGVMIPSVFADHQGGINTEWAHRVASEANERERIAELERWENLPFLEKHWNWIILGSFIAVIGVFVCIGIAVSQRSKTPKPAAKPKPVKQKPAKKKETSAFCENCGNTLNPKAKFCGSCGNQV